MVRWDLYACYEVDFDAMRDGKARGLSRFRMRSVGLEHGDLELAGLAPDATESTLAFCRRHFIMEDVTLDI